MVGNIPTSPRLAIQLPRKSVQIQAFGMIPRMIRQNCSRATETIFLRPLKRMTTRVPGSADRRITECALTEEIKRRTFMATQSLESRRSKRGSGPRLSGHIPHASVRGRRKQNHRNECLTLRNRPCQSLSTSGICCFASKKAAASGQ